MQNTTRILIAALCSALAAGPVLAEHGHRDRDGYRGKGHQQERHLDRHHDARHNRHKDRHAYRDHHRDHHRDHRRDAHRHGHRWHHDRGYHRGWDRGHHRGWDRKHHARKHGYHHDRRYHGRVNGYYYASTPWKIQLFDRHHRLRTTIPLGRNAHWKVKGNRIFVYGRHRVHVYGGPRFHLIRSYSRNHYDRHQNNSGLHFSFRF